MTISITTQHDGADRYRSRIRGHTLLVDQPPADAGPTPLELFVASFVSCAAFYAGRFLVRHGIAGHQVEGTATQAADGRVVGIELTLRTARPLPEAVALGATRAMEHCTVARSVVGSVAVTVRIGAAEAVPV